MKIEDWKSVAELVGIAAIVASLVFVGLQMRQSQEIAIAQQYQDRSASALNFYTSRMQSDSALELAAQNLDASHDIDKSPIGLQVDLGGSDSRLIAQAYLEYRANMTQFDNYHFQYEQGFMQLDAWLAFRARLKVLLANSFNAQLYRQQSDTFRASFQDICNELLNEISSEGNN